MENLVSKYFSDNCTASEVEEVKKFALSNEREFAEYKKVWEMTNAYSYPKSQLDFNDLKEEIEGSSKIELLPNKIRYSPIWRVAAAVLLLAVLGFGLFNKYESKDSYTQIVTIQNSIERLTLEDGTLISAKKGAVIAISDDFNGEYRVVKLEGEAFFDVAKDKNKPFIIHTVNMDVKVLGTSFLVKDNKVEVKSGKVHVSNAKGGVDLVKGEFALLNNGLVEKGILESANNKWAWVDKVLVFENMDLASVITDIENTYAVKVAYDVTFKDLRFTGKFENQKLNEVIQVIEESLGIKLSFTPVIK